MTFPDILELHALKHGHPHRITKDYNDILELIRMEGTDIFCDDFAAFCHRYGDEAILRKIRNENPLDA